MQNETVLRPKALAFYTVKRKKNDQKIKKFGLADEGTFKTNLVIDLDEIDSATGDFFICFRDFTTFDSV